MIYTSTITSQGTITVPAEIRKKYRLKTGDTLIIEDNGDIVIKAVPSIEQMRATNKRFVQNGKGNAHTYRNGDGIASYITEKYGTE